MYYTGGVYEEYGKALHDFNGQHVPLKWVLFIHCELLAWLIEALMIVYVLYNKRFIRAIKATMIVWAISRAFDVLQFYLPNLLYMDQITITIKLLFNIGILFIAIIYFDTEEEDKPQ